MQKRPWKRRSLERNPAMQFLLRVRCISWGSCGIIGKRGLRSVRYDRKLMTEPAAGKDKTLGEFIRETGSPAARLIGFEVPEHGNGRALVTLQAGPQHTNPMGTLHGGILCDIADAAMGIAFASTLAP